MKILLYRLWQWTWGLPQTLAGLALALLHRDCPRESYHGAVCVRWQRRYGLSLGMFTFLPPGEEGWFRVHEYGHTIQSLFLGPLYLPLVGLPSLLWGTLPVFKRRWESGQVPYDSVYPENWATRLGRRFTGESGGR